MHGYFGEFLKLIYYTMHGTIKIGIFCMSNGSFFILFFIYFFSLARPVILDNSDKRKTLSLYVCFFFARLFYT